MAFDRAAGYYDETRAYPEGVPEQVAAALVRSGSLSARHRVLEIGVGTGRIALPLSPHVGGMHGVDLAQPMLQRLLQKPGAGSVSPLRADATRLPYASGVFDAAVTTHVFHLIPGWRTAAAELHRVLRPGGLFLESADGYVLRSVWDGVHEELPWLAQNLSASPLPIDFPLQVGFVRHASEHVMRYRQRVDLAETRRQLRERVWSLTWRLGDDQLAELVSAFERSLLSQFGELDGEVDDAREFRVRIYRK